MQRSHGEVTNYYMAEITPIIMNGIHTGTYYSTANMKKDDLITKADKNLYLAKNSGRNKVIFTQ